MRSAPWIIRLAPLLLAACSGPPAERGTIEEAFEADLLRQGPRGTFTALTRNAYLGADIDRVLAAPSPEAIPGIAGAVWATVQANDFPRRARTLAWEIGVTQPDVVALQEVGLWRTGPGDSCQGGTAPAEEVVYDYLELLQAELARRGARYVVAASGEAFDGELCALVDGAFVDVRYTDRDALLVRADRPFSNAAQGQYAAAVNLLVGGAVPIRIPRGWVAADVELAGSTVHVVGTHLEVGAGFFGAIQQQQAQELIGLLAAEAGPLLVAGDFNSAADGSTTTTYGDLVAAGLADPWPVIHPGVSGFTCCFDEELLSGDLTSRIDLTLARGGPSPVFTFRVGSQPWERLRTGRWPSDHAGVVTLFALHGP